MSKLGEWTPVTALPEENGCYLCTIRVLKESTYLDVLSFSTDLYNIDKYNFARYKGKQKAGFFCYDSEYGYVEVKDVLAWMPEPEHYKGE